MPLIRCQKCGQAYDVPGVVAVRLPNSIATCECGEWISGSKAALLAGMLNPEKIKEIDLRPYKTTRTGEAAQPATSAVPGGTSLPRSVRVVARGAQESVDKVRSDEPTCPAYQCTLHIPTSRSFGRSGPAVTQPADGYNPQLCFVLNPFPSDDQMDTVVASRSVCHVDGLCGAIQDGMCRR